MEGFFLFLAVSCQLLAVGYQQIAYSGKFLATNTRILEIPILKFQITNYGHIF
ncbi:MAG: hypothetical protein RL699_1876 [Bacteroidota bacterium]|jgi:hypothetical protein